MSKLIDLTDKKFNLLTVKRYIGKSKWLCECECGKLVEVFANNLKSGHTKSCGCIKFSADLTDKRFDKLVAKYRVEGKFRGKTKRVLWHCVCDCGNEIDVYSDSLTSGNTMSCGCIQANKQIPDKLQEQFIKGTQISRLNGIMTKANKSGVVGVNWDKSRNKWQAGIKFKGHRYNLGRFDTIDEAAEVRKLAQEKLHGEFLEWYKEYKKSKG